MTVDTYDIPISTLAYGGDALGRLPDGSPHPGLAVFVPFALPGETVRVRLVEEKRGHARAELDEVLIPSPDRITPRCPHFFSIHNQGSVITNFPCGGCHYQHLSYPAQLLAKSAILREQLERIASLENPPIQPIVPSPHTWNYRNHVQFHLTPQGRLGYEAARSHRVLPICECHLPEESINQLWPQIELEPLPGLERVSLRAGVEGDLLLILEGGDPKSFQFTVEELPISAVHITPSGSFVLAGGDYLLMEVGISLPPLKTQVQTHLSPESNFVRESSEARSSSPLTRLFHVSAVSFFQVNSPQAGAMVEHLLANLPLKPTTMLLEVYSGVGLFSAFLAPHVGRLIGIESAPSACQDFEANLEEFDHIELYEAPAEIVLPALDLHPDVILVDPPRAGLAPTVMEGILNLNAPTLAYVSCDPATLARDAHRLIEGGYHLRQVTPFDLFPQTYHIESISIWER